MALMSVKVPTRVSTMKASVNNALTGTVTADYTKTWRALAFQGELTDVWVEFVLQAKHVESNGTDDDQWYMVQENGADVTQSLSGFDEEMTSMSRIAAVCRNMTNWGMNWNTAG